LRAVLAYAYNTSPTLLRDATAVEITAMVEVVEAVAASIESAQR
jgi:hypothetical protein